MSELLLQGATMTNAHCSDCSNPIFRYDGQEFCANCEKAVSREQSDDGGSAVEVTEPDMMHGSSSAARMNKPRLEQTKQERKPMGSHKQHRPVPTNPDHRSHRIYHRKRRTPQSKCHRKPDHSDDRRRRHSNDQRNHNNQETQPRMLTSRQPVMLSSGHSFALARRPRLLMTRAVRKNISKPHTKPQKRSRRLMYNSFEGNKYNASKVIASFNSFEGLFNYFLRG